MEVKTKADIHQLIDSCPDYYTADKIVLHIVNTMLHNNEKYFALDIANDVNKYLNNYVLNSIHACNLINERAKYLESYLDGTMYKEEKPEYKEVQKIHAKYIKDISEALLTDSIKKVIEDNIEKYQV